MTRTDSFARRLGAWALARVAVLDPVLTAVLGALAIVGLLTLYSAGADFPWRFQDQMRNFAIAAVLLFAAASVPPALLARLAPIIYGAGLVLLVAVALVGVEVKGARRWLNLGVATIQPSEIMKLAVPLALAWYFSRREGLLRSADFALAALIVAVPVALIARQPDLGTAVLVLAAGLFIIFFAGLPWKWLALGAGTALAALPLVWMSMHDYQRQRVLTLIDPEQDPLGKGFHTLQAMIAIGSGGVLGKGWMKGTQTHLEFIPERTSDFIFAVFSEEFGLIGNMVLLGLYLALVLRALGIAGGAATLFGRLLAGALGLIVFTYAFVNIGMVIGLLPVVGVPLPFVSYGGTALVTLALALGMLMAIQRSRRLVQT